MMPEGYPRVTVDLKKLSANARRIKELCLPCGVDVTAVVKCTCAAPEVARAILAGGISRLGDSRVQNIRRLREAGIEAPITLLRSPMQTEAREVVRLADRSLVSDLAAIEALARHARELGRHHEVVLMVDMGDLREGFWPDGDNEDVESAVRRVLEHKHLSLVGLGVNLLCFGAIIPTRSKMDDFLRVADRVRRMSGLDLPVISGGNSANLPLVLSERLPRGITELRIGEGILQGTEAVTKQQIPGCSTDVFTFSAEVIEVRRKPSVPVGESGIDAFGGKPVFLDKGTRLRAILAAGRQDIEWDDIVPREKGIEVLGSSSDHLVLDVDGSDKEIHTGDIVDFDMGYAALLRASTSEFVAKRFLF
jgi:ornithine racemase